MHFPFTQELRALRARFGELPIFREVVASGSYKLYSAVPALAAPSPEAIRAAAEALGVELPRSYLAFLAGNTHRLPPQLFVFGFGGVDPEFDLVSRNLSFREEFASSVACRGRDLPSELVAFGTDGAIDVFAFDYTSVNAAGEPAIVRWHEMKEKQPLAADFETFIASEIERLESFLGTIDRAVADFRPALRRFEDDVYAYVGLLPRTRPPILLLDFATELTFDAYLAHGKFDALIARGHRSVDRKVRLLSERLAEIGDGARLGRLWKGILARCEAPYRRAWKSRKQPGGRFDDARNELVTALEEAARAYSRIGNRERADELAESLSTIQGARPLPAPPRPTDSRKMDEPLFWSIIEQASAGASSPEERLIELERILSGFKTPGVRAFGRIFHKQASLLNSWDIWALAYLRQDGCSDDGFEYFRFGLVLLGREVVTALRTDLAAGAALLPEGEIESEEAASLAGSILEARGSEASEFPVSDISGKAWEEDEVVSRYPELARLYGRL